MSINSLTVPHSLWWGCNDCNSKGENLKLLEYVKNNDGPVNLYDGELRADDSYHWEYETGLISTKIHWWRK